MSADELLALAERCEAADPSHGRDLELYAGILNAVIGVDAPDAKKFYGAGRLFTESLDAAVALCERVLPGWRGDLDLAPFEPGDNCGARLFPPKSITNIAGEAATPALALIAAVLRALASQVQPSTPEVRPSDQNGEETRG